MARLRTAAAVERAHQNQKHGRRQSAHERTVVFSRADVVEEEIDFEERHNVFDGPVATQNHRVENEQHRARQSRQNGCESAHQNS